LSSQLRSPPSSTRCPYTTLFRSQLLQLGAGDVPGEAEEHLTAVDDVPGLRLAVRAAEVLGGEGVVGMDVYRQALPGLEQLDQQRSEEHTSELQSRFDLVCRLLLE